MSFTTYSGNAILDCFLRGVAPTPPTAVYVSLHTGAPGNDGANEVSTDDWPAYVRKDAADGGAVATAFAAAADKASTNEKQMLWPAHDGEAPITITHCAIWTAASGGECALAGALKAEKTINPTDEFVLYAAELDVTVT